MTGETVDLSNATASGTEKSLKHLTEVVEPEVARGTLRVGDIRCPKCDLNEIFVVLMQTRSSDEPETKICTCKNCGKKFREYQ
jgi:DNA-directed RNA polymerase subunit M